jgi:hypothetical protein
VLKAHSLVALFGCFVSIFLPCVTLTTFVGRHVSPVFAVGRELPMETGQVHSRFRRQRRQLGDKIQRLEDDVRGPIAVGRFELIANIARGCQ